MLNFLSKIPVHSFARLTRTKALNLDNFYTRLKTHKVKSNLDYKFPFQTLTNPMIDKYIEVKESVLCGVEGARKSRKRVGRGPGSTLGKTSGKGHKGQGQRGTKKKYGFEGGQTPIYKRQPKMGKLVNNFLILNNTNIRRIVEHYKRGWLNWDENNYLTIKNMCDSGAAGCKHGVKLYEYGFELLDAIQKPLFIEVTDVSEEAFREITKRGGKVRIVHRDREEMNHHLHPEQYSQRPE